MPVPLGISVLPCTFLRSQVPTMHAACRAGSMRTAQRLQTWCTFCMDGGSPSASRGPLQQHICSAGSRGLAPEHALCQGLCQAVSGSLSETAVKGCGQCAAEVRVPLYLADQVGSSPVISMSCWRCTAVFEDSVCDRPLGSQAGMYASSCAASSACCGQHSRGRLAMCQAGGHPGTSQGSSPATSPSLWRCAAASRRCLSGAQLLQLLRAKNRPCSCPCTIVMRSILHCTQSPTAGTCRRPACVHC